MTTINSQRSHPEGRIGAGLIIGAFVVGVVAAGHAMGQAEGIDTDGDGMVSYTELLVVMPEVTENQFAEMDADASGLLDATELMAAQDAGLLPAG